MRPAHINFSIGNGRRNEFVAGAELGKINHNMNVTLRPFSPEDPDFLFRLYASTRREELAPFGWPPAQQDVFLRMQFDAQRRWYEIAYSGADHQLILVDEKPAGRILVFRDKDGNRLVDIALLSEYRNLGIGTRLLRELIGKCETAGLPLRLQVLKNNPARRLYERLGFVTTGEDQMYYEMERKPA
jgi:ribosomal protein S18 acetylase RimI-like enzyme